ncbi:MAG: hypothetical protein KAJ59_04500 [Thermodesulfovibrionia bacterium]|nr:hypothetical protein [Thermodesulfovibrionia bacterium]
MSIKKSVVIIFFALFFTVSGLSAEQKTFKGTVTYTENTGNYTYIKVSEDGREVWLATSPIKVSIGNKVEYMGGVVMKNFHSKSLNRDFESIRFVSHTRVLNGDSSKGKQTAPDKDYHKDISKDTNMQRVSIPKRGEIAKAEHGKTIEEIFAKKEQLKGKNITIHAKVIKVNKNIMNKNWVTLSDGTGVAPDDKLTATTSENVKIGDILTVKGIVKTDVSIGAGYRYRVLIEDAQFTQ